MGAQSCAGTIMNALVILAACVSACSAQFYAQPGSVINPAPSTQFHAQDEFGQFSFGHAGGPSARTEARNAYGVTTGSYQYIDANGLLQTVNYVADPVHGFRVAGTNLPVGPAALAAPEVAPLVAPTFNPEPLVAPVFTGVAPEPVEDTPEVAEAKAAHLALLEAANSERKRRDADEEAAVVAAPAIAALPYPYAAGLNLAYAGLPLAAPAVLPAAAAVAHAPIVKSVVETPAAVETEVAATPVISYAAAPAIAAPALSYAAAPAIAAPVATPLAAAAPVAVAAAAPSRDAVLTQIKLNPGHATFYRVD